MVDGIITQIMICVSMFQVHRRYRNLNQESNYRLSSITPATVLACCHSLWPLLFFFISSKFEHLQWKLTQWIFSNRFFFFLFFYMILPWQRASMFTEYNTCEFIYNIFFFGTALDFDAVNTGKIWMHLNWMFIFRPFSQYTK